MIFLKRYFLRKNQITNLFLKIELLVREQIIQIDF